MNTKTNSKRKILLLALTLVMVLGTLTACGGGNAVKAKVITINLTEEQYAFGVDKDQPELLEKTNAFIKKIKEHDVITCLKIVVKEEFCNHNRS